MTNLREETIEKLIKTSNEQKMTDGISVYKEQGVYKYLIDDRPGYEKKERLIFIKSWDKFSDWSIKMMSEIQETSIN